MSFVSFNDMTGRTVLVNYPPQKIISLVPSQTELLFDLGLEDETIGITKFCIHPDSWFRTKKRIGGTKNVNIEAIKALQPDLIIANKEENTKEQVELLATLFPVWISDIKSIEEAIEMIKQIGAITDKNDQAERIVENIRHNKDSIAKEKNKAEKVAYLIWRNPWMCAGGDTFISNMITEAGWTNVFSDRQRYPEITLEELKVAIPDHIFLSSEPYPFKETHIREIKESIPDVKITLVDGEMFSWYGSRLIMAFPYLNELKKSLENI